MTSVIWEVIEKLVCRATVLDRDEFTIGGTLERYTQEKFKNILFETQKLENDMGKFYEKNQIKEDIGGGRGGGICNNKNYQYLPK